MDIRKKISFFIGAIYLVPVFILLGFLYSSSESRFFEYGRSAYYLAVLLAIGLILVKVAALFLNKAVLNRVSALNECIDRIAANSDLTIRAPLTGADELTVLVKKVNHMLDNLQLFHDQLAESRQHLLDIIEFLPDPTLVIDASHRVVAWNRAIEAMTGISKEEILGKGDYLYSFPFYGSSRPMLLDLVTADPLELKRYYDSAEKLGTVFYAEMKVILPRQDKEAHLWATASPLYNKQGDLMGAIESIRDISERKKTEEQLKYLSLHDPLTGLYNRTYFEKEIRRLEGGRQTAVGLVICDVDGLKLINDSLGHSAGDQLLKAAASALKRSFRSSDVVARIGGDEFAVLLPECDGPVLEQIGARIQESIGFYNQTHPGLPLSISTGWAFCGEGAKNMTAVYEEADNNMYQEKLQRGRHARGAIIQTLVKTLGVRDFIAEGHPDRMKSLMISLARRLRFTDRKIHDMSLLAQFHDIGKVGVPDSILFKPGPLNPEEREIMQRHAEIGYGIARSAQDLLHISDWILMHHEWWDGNGYPNGLKNEGIPLECRMLAIVDAYDAITSDRPYRRALSHAEAVAELQRCSGTQFDPELVEVFLQMMEELRTNTA